MSALAKFVILRYRNRLMVTACTVTRHDVDELFAFALSDHRPDDAGAERVRILPGVLDDADLRLSLGAADRLVAMAFDAEGRLFAQGRAG